MKAWLLCLVLALTCQAQQNVVVSVASYLSDFVGGTGTTTCRPANELSLGGPSQLTCESRSYAVPPRSQGRWGTPSGGTQKSGLGFEGVQGKTVALNTDFFLGNMVHFNYPISQGTAASGIKLNIFFTVSTTSGTLIGTYLYNFQMQVDETLNQTPCVYPSQAGNPCADKIFFGNTLNANTSFTLGQVDYTLQLRGFKESNSSSSSPVQYFISNEQQSSQAFLFARITAACPRTCVNGGSYILSSSQECVCDCSNVNCPYTAQVTTPNCTCQCPDLNACNNGAGGVLRPDCTCNCQSCPSPLLTDPSDCSCSCPTNYCGVGTINNPNTCSCNCPSTACPIANEIRDGRCNCVCNLTCQSPKIENPSSSVCGCTCPSTTCPTGYTINPNTCQCDCTRTCVNAPLITSSCTCGPCVGNWTLAPNNTCTLCKLNQTSCKSGEAVDAATCTCQCTQLNCNLYNDGQVIDQNNYCACRPCTAGECYCGNGIVEAGEDCDEAGNPCCQQCKYTTASCTDNNGCTQQDTCNGHGVCVGEYKCPPSTDCANITCNPTVGTCVTTNYPDNSNCGAQPYDLCTRRCMSGVCSNTPIVCDPDTNLDDCMVPVCNPLTGTCPYVPITDTNYGCSDEDGCTTNDHCVNGTCQGSPVVCTPSTDPCKTMVCTDNLCQAVGLSNIPCNADNNNCTVGDYCFQGVCQTGPMTNCTAGADQCKSPYCDAGSGTCQFLLLNTTCNDANSCTTNDTCTNGVCSGTLDPAVASAVECGGTPPVTPESVNNTSALIFGLTGAAALIGAIAGIAFLVKKIRDSKLLDPETWDPDKFSSVGSNPLYKGSEKTVDNRMYEGSM